MDYTKIERIIIQSKVTDRMPPSILDRMLKWDSETINLSRCFIAFDELEMAREIQRTHAIGMLPIVIVEDRREHWWPQWQQEYGLPPFMISFYLQDAARCQRLINAPGIQFFNHLKSLFVNKEAARKERNSELLIDVEKALGESLVGWLGERKNLAKQIFNDVSRITISESEMLAPDEYGNKYWDTFAGCWFDSQQKPGGLLAILNDIGIKIELVEETNRFEVVGENGITNWSDRLSKTFDDLLKGLGNLLKEPDGYKPAYLGSEVNKHPAFCIPMIHQDGACQNLLLVGIPSELTITMVELNNEVIERNSEIDIAKLNQLDLQPSLYEKVKSIIKDGGGVYCCSVPEAFKWPAGKFKISANYVTGEDGENCIVTIKTPASDA